MTTIYEWPAAHRGAVTGSFRLRSRSILSRGAITEEAFPHGPVVRRWTAKVTLPPKSETAWRELDGFVSRLGGISGLVRLGDPFRRQPGYNRSTTPTTSTFDDDTEFTDGSGFANGLLPPAVIVSEAAVKGATEIVVEFPSGLTSKTNVIRTGDLMEVRPNGVPATHGHLYVATFPASTDANAKTRIRFEPGLRAAVAAGDTLVLQDAKSVFRLASDDEGEIEVDAAYHGRVGFSFVEVLPT